MVHLNGIKLKAEVIEIAGNEAKLQVFEDTRDVEYGTSVYFEEQLLEAELGSGTPHLHFGWLAKPPRSKCQMLPDFSCRGDLYSAARPQRRWDYEPRVKVGKWCSAEIPWGARKRDVSITTSWCLSLFTALMRSPG